MVDVGVGEEDIVDLTRQEGQGAVQLEGCFSLPLVEATVEQQLRAIRLDDV